MAGPFPDPTVSFVAFAWSRPELDGRDPDPDSVDDFLAERHRHSPASWSSLVVIAIFALWVVGA